MGLANRVGLAAIDGELQHESGRITVVARLEEPTLDSTATRETNVGQLRRNADRAQAAVESFVADRTGIAVENSFWITNAVVLTVDTNRVPLSEVARIRGVERLHANHEFEPIDDPAESAGGESGSTTTASPAAGDSSGETLESTTVQTTYGVDMVNAPDVWSSHGAKGGGVTVAALDTGVDPDHPDIDLHTTDSTDPTYPGGWQEWDNSGNPLDTEPQDPVGHGTHVSGTISGGAASGEHIGVAPDVTLLHGKVLDNDLQLWAQVIAGIQWAVDQGADVISMSLGMPDVYEDSVVDPVRNAQSAGTNVVVATGNEGDGTSRSPGNVYDVTSVGAVDSTESVADFSSGEGITTADAWTDPPADWPDSYVIPDVTAPGVAVKSASPGGGYTEKPGTSMACPHVAGVLALMKSATGPSATVDTLRTAAFETTRKPGGDPTTRDTRYGLGIVDAKAATDLLALDSGVEGTVTDAGGNPIEGATVATDTFSTTTASDGTYSLVAHPGDVTVTAEDFGYVTQSHTVAVSDGNFATRNFSLDPTLATRLTSGPAETIEGGESVSFTVEVAHADSVTVSQQGDYDVADATLAIDGSAATFGQSVSLGGGIQAVTVTVTTAPDTAGTLSLEATFAGTGSTATVAPGLTSVYASSFDVGILDAGNNYRDQIAATLSDQLPGRYRTSPVSADSILSDLDSYDVIVVQALPSDGQFVSDFASQTAGAAVGTVYLDQWGSTSNAIQRLAANTAIVDSLTTDYTDSSPQFFLARNHAIFDGVGAANDTVPVHLNDSFGDRATFSGFDGVTLADVGIDSPEGSAIGVDACTSRILLSAHGYSSYTSGNFSAEAKAILGNAVAYLAGDDTGPVLNRRWSFDVGKRVQGARPDGDADRVYLGGLGETLYAIRRDEGTVAWSLDRSGELSDSSPLVANGRVYVGSGGGIFYALNAGDGSVDWTHDAGSAITASPATDGTDVYVAANDGTVGAFDAAGGAIKWTQSVGAPVYSTLSVVGGTVYLTTADGTVVALDAAGGGIQWEYATGSPVGGGSPTVAGGTVVVASDRVYALDVGSGGEVWTGPVGQFAGATPAVESGTVYVGDHDGTFYALDAGDGSTVWARSVGDAVASRPVVDGDYVLAGSTEGTVVALDVNSGDRADRIGLTGPSRSSPGVLADELYLGTEDGTVEAFRFCTDSSN